MRSRTIPGLTASLCLLVMQVVNSVAQPPPPKPAERPEIKLPTILTAKPLKADPQDDELRKLLIARYNEAVSEMKALVDQAHNQLDAPRLLRVYEPTERLKLAGLELWEKPADRIRWLTQYLELTRDAEKSAQARHDAGIGYAGELHRTRYQRIDTEILLLREKRRANEPKK